MTLVGCFAALIVGSSIISCFSNDLKRSLLFLWICGVAVGGVYLSLGLEFLAILQWLLTTAMVISFFFYFITFGEFGVSKKWTGFFPVLIGATFSALFCGSVLTGLRGFGLDLPVLNSSSENLETLSKVLMEEYFLSVPVLGLILFLAGLGCGVIAREEGRK